MGDDELELDLGEDDMDQPDDVERVYVKVAERAGALAEYESHVEACVAADKAYRETYERVFRKEAYGEAYDRVMNPKPPSPDQGRDEDVPF